MTSEQKEESSKLTYDDRRKELIQEKTQITENKTELVMDGEKVVEESKILSNVEHKLRIVYSEEGIKLAHKNLSKQRTGMEQRLSILKEQLKDHKELPEDLKKLKEDIDKITLFAAGEQKKLELEDMEKELKTVKKEFDELKSTIGSRLKL